ncbi:MAG: LamG-like jellyroll fold domain-containing protein, partial [Bacteroidota bacterium]
GTVVNDTVWNATLDTVLAFYRYDTLYRAEYVPTFEERGDAFAYMSHDTLWQMGSSAFSLRVDDHFENAQGAWVAFYDDPYLRSASYGPDGHPEEGDIYGIMENDTAWGYDPRTVYAIEQTDTMAIRLLDTLYSYPNLNTILYFKLADQLHIADYITVNGYDFGTPQYLLWKNTLLNLAADSVKGIGRGDTLYTHRVSFMGLKGTDDTVRMEGNQAFALNSAGRIFHLQYDDVISEVPELVRTDNKDMYKARFFLNVGGGVSVTSDTLYAGEYANLMVAYDGSTLTLYVDGKEAASTAASGSLATTDALELGRGNSSYFHGYVDEVLVWQEAADSAAAYRNHGRYLIGNEENLVGYWRIDENVGDFVYDASRDDAIEDEVLKYNRRHGALVGGPVWEDVVPDPDLLGFAGFTDAAGNYTIPAIRYKGSGENFKVVPVYLTHEFDPSDRILFLGEGSAVHNGVNFIDISSFKVTGFVKVDPAAFGWDRDDPAAPSCYIKGAYLNLDGNLVVKNNLPVVTDASGKFEMEVPIGDHQISVTLAGHSFSLGKWPVNTEYHDFQEPISGITFYDDTQRHWVGKVVGGNTEGDIFPGFNNTTNNIGVADIRVTSLGNECFVKEFSTDVNSGEFYVSLPPLQYRVDQMDISTQGPTFNSELRLLSDEMINLASPIMSVEGELAKDTTYHVDNGDKSVQNIKAIDSIRYHLRKDYVYEALPEFIITSRDSTTHFGDEELAYADPLDDTNGFTLDLTTNPFGYPVFTGGAPYALRIWVMERYYNFDADAANPVIYEVPVPDASIEIQNEVGGLAEQHTLENGYLVHQFYAAEPQTQEGGDFPLTRTIEITGPRGVKWLPNVGATEWEQTFRAYVLGSSSQGDNDFVTVFDEADTATEGGVKMVDFILRDPPGSQSYAYWKENTTLKTYVDTKFSVGYFGQIQTSAGSSFTLYNFLSGNKLFENKAVFINSVNGKVAGGGRFVRETTYTTRQTITTNSNPYKPGAPSDLFVGTARNVLVGYADAVKLIPISKCDEDGVYCTGPVISNASGDFRLGKYEEFVISPEQNFATTFVYTQDHIERELVTLADKRNRLFATPYYESYLDADHPAYGYNNSDPLLADHGLSVVSNLGTDTDDGASYLYHRDSDPRSHPIDLVRYYNNQIKIWRQILAANEKEKLEAIDKANNGDSERENWSFGSGVKIESASGVVDRDLDAFTWEFELTLRRGTLVDTDATGVKVKLESYHGLQFKESGSSVTDFAETTDIGYVLYDKDINDQISVDVIESHKNNGPIFVTKGGRTSCPWEPQRLVQHYEPAIGTQLSAGTVARDQPTIDIFPRSLHNVPADEKATFRVILGNENYTDSVRFYSLYLDSRTNPDGAEIRIDEQRIVGLNSFRIPMNAGELQEKTLNLQITATEFEYEDLKIYFHSPCQFNLGTTFEKSITDSAYLSAYFIPECTDVLFRTPTDKWTLNYEFNDSLDVAIGGYNYNYYQFDNVKFQIKESSESDDRWLTWNTFWHTDSEERPDPKTIRHDSIPDDQFSIDYTWDVAQLTDGSYDLRATTTCGPEDVVTTSPVYSGIIDRVNPHPFGRPQPRDGILGPGDEIQITFNERIDAGKLTWDNFDIRGVLNGGELRHGASVYFDGSNKDYLRVNGLLMRSQSFTLEFWAKRLSSGEEVILGQGRPGT